jgi:hypothetical protein
MPNSIVPAADEGLPNINPINVWKQVRFEIWRDCNALKAKSEQGDIEAARECAVLLELVSKLKISECEFTAADYMLYGSDIPVGRA